MGLENKIKQSAILMTVGLGLALFTKYSGIDNILTSSITGKEKEQKIEETEEQTFKERYTQLKGLDYEKNNPTQPKVKENIKKEQKKASEIKKNIETIDDYTVEDITKEYKEQRNYKNTNSEKKIFIYHQNLSSNDMMKEAMEICEYWMPHFYEIKQEKIGYDKKRKKNITKTVWENRANDKKLKNLVKSSHADNIMPMISAFERKSVMSVLDNPHNYAKRIRKEIDKVGAHGVSIDLESIDVGKEESKKLINFMKILRNEMRGYIINIAVSPRFDGSAEQGFKHHGFYDYEKLAPYVDFVNIMMYDFHKDKVGPIMPAHLVEKILAYAKENLPKEKIVPLFPLYSHQWRKDKNGKYKPESALNSKIIGDFIKNNPIKEKKYDNGELRIETKNGKIVYAQDGATFYNRLKRVQNNDIKNFGGWKQNHASKDMYAQMKYWKQKK